MDPFKFTTIAHRNHVFCNPLGEQTVEHCLGLLGLAPEDRVIDVGCGKGEFLIRLVERTGARAVGVDRNPGFLREAAERAAARIPGGKLSLHLTDIAEFRAEAGSFAAALCIGSTHAYGDYPSTLRALSGLAPPGGRILVGEGYWKRDPDPEYLAFLGARAADCTDHAGNVAAGVEQGLVPLYTEVSSDADWDAYEDLYASTMGTYVAAHPEDPDANTLGERMRVWRSGYQRWGRDTLGFGVYLFQK